MTDDPDGILQKAALDALRHAFRTRICELRVSRGWSPAEAAGVSKMGRSAWYRLERGETDPTLKTLVRLRLAFGLSSIEALFGPLPSERAIDEATVASPESAAVGHD